MKNLFLALTLVVGFGIALFVKSAPQEGEFVAEINTTLSQLSQDLSVVSKSASAKRVRDTENKSRSDSVFANAVAHSALVSSKQAKAQIDSAEPDCGGWND